MESQMGHHASTDCMVLVQEKLPYITAFVIHSKLVQKCFLQNLPTSQIQILMLSDEPSLSFENTCC